MKKQVSSAMGNPGGVHSGVTPPVSDPEPMPLFGKAWEAWQTRMIARADALYIEHEMPERRGSRIRRHGRTHEQKESSQEKYV